MKGIAKCGHPFGHMCSSCAKEVAHANGDKPSYLCGTCCGTANSGSCSKAPVDTGYHADYSSTSTSPLPAVD